MGKVAVVTEEEVAAERVEEGWEGAVQGVGVQGVETGVEKAIHV